MKRFQIKAVQCDYYSNIYIVSAESEREAKSKVENLTDDEPLSEQKDTYDRTVVELSIVPQSLTVYTVEELFNIDDEECYDKVIRLDDLTDEQKQYLGLHQKGA